MSAGQQLIRNVGLTYARMALSVVFSLYTTRLLYDVLSASDIGVFNVLGSSVALIEVMRHSLSASAVRNLSYSIGRGDTALLRKTINTLYALFLALAISFYLVGQAVGPLLLNLLQIPDERAGAAWWVYQFSLLNLAWICLQAPVRAVFIAKQAFATQVLLELPGSLLNLALVSALYWAPGDELVNYAIFLFSARLLLGIAAIVTCCWRFPESRFTPGQIDVSLAPQLARFAGWSALGDIATQLRDRGSALLLNLFFGPVVANAAWELSWRAGHYNNMLIQGLRRGLAPVLISSEGAGRREQAAQISLIGGRFAGLISLFISVPLIADINNALSLWIKQPPPNASLFVIYASIMASLIALSSGFLEAMQATDDIGPFMRRSWWIILLPLPLTTFAYLLGGPIWLIVAITIACSVTLTVVQAAFTGPRIGFTFGQWLRSVVAPFLLIGCLAAAATLPARLLLDEGIHRLLIVGLSSTVAITLGSWLFVLTRNERGAVLNALRRLTAGRSAS